MTERREDERNDAEERNLDMPVPYVRLRAAQRALVSVPFKPVEFEHVVAAAEQSGERVSVFVRGAALEKADTVMAAATYRLAYSEPANDAVFLMRGDSSAFLFVGSEKAGAVSFEQVQG